MTHTVQPTHHDDTGPSSSPRIAIFAAFSGHGGVERMLANLAAGLLVAGYRVDMVLAKQRGEHLAAIPAAVRQIPLGSRHTATSLPALIGYLRRERPAALLAAKDRAIRTAVMARALSGVTLPLVGRLGTTVSAALSGKGWLRRTIWYSNMRLFYRRVDTLIAVSEGVRQDILQITNLAPSQVRVVRNPVITPQLSEQAALPCDHPWLTSIRDTPVIVAAGRLTHQKDFPTLLRAFARLRTERCCRLLILGEGGDRGTLLTLAEQLGIRHDVDLPGFRANPYPYLAAANLFVLSSRWEGSPNVLTEALALGTPVVATDCPSGPRELLAGGRYGALVTPGDVSALASAMGATLDQPLPAATLRQAVADYTIDQAAAGYLQALTLPPSANSAVPS